MPLRFGGFFPRAAWAKGEPSTAWRPRRQVDGAFVKGLRDIVPALSDLELLRIGLITSDARLRAKFRDFADRHHVRVEMSETTAEAQTLMLSPDVSVRVLDYAAKTLLPESLLRAHAFLGGKPDDIVVVVAPSGEVENERRVAFSRKSTDAVLEEVRRAIPAKKSADAADAILGRSDVILRVRDQVRHIARFKDVPVMILGETGTGKELVAEAIHRLGAAEDPLVAVNCAAIPSELVESELFGHEAGAYTGARAARVGLLESAGQGTIFLDEIGEMPIVLQPKLLRALEQRRFRRVGASTDTSFRARIVSATNRALDGGQLRADIRYRLAGFTISLPPLRVRSGDVEILAHAFLNDFGDRHKLSPIWFTSEALSLLRQHNWPGNVRELRGVVQHAAIVANARAVNDDAVMQALSQSEATAPTTLTAPTAHAANAPNAANAANAAGHERPAPAALDSGESFLLKDRNRALVLDTFQRTGQNVSQTARMLGIARATLRDRLKKYGVR